MRSFWLLGLALSACSSPAPTMVQMDAGIPPPEDAAMEAMEAEPMTDPLIVARPYDLFVPSGYDGSKPMALVFAFHGYGPGDDSSTIDNWFQIKPLAESEGFFYVTPSATKDKAGYPAWNGTDACCDFDKRNIDDVAYIRAIIDDIAAHYDLDAKRVFITGVSGGGFFVHRLACDLADKIAAAVSLSGATYADTSKCKPSAPLALVEVHGDMDDTVLYDGGVLKQGKINAVYPSAQETVQHWSAYDLCTGPLMPTGEMLDLVPNLAGSETKVEAYGCPKGMDVQRWTVQGGPHAPLLSSEWAKSLWRFFQAHPKP
jgi:polyhydroxybutyrate depolymerase